MLYEAILIMMGVFSDGILLVHLPYMRVCIIYEFCVVFFFLHITVCLFLVAY